MNAPEPTVLVPVMYEVDEERMALLIGQQAVADDDAWVLSVGQDPDPSLADLLDLVQRALRDGTEVEWISFRGDDRLEAWARAQAARLFPALARGEVPA